MYLFLFRHLQCEPNLLPEPNHVMLNHLYALSIKVCCVELEYFCYIVGKISESFSVSIDATNYFKKSHAKALSVAYLLVLNGFFCLVFFFSGRCHCIKCYTQIQEEICDNVTIQTNLVNCFTQSMIVNGALVAYYQSLIT